MSLRVPAPGPHGGDGARLATALGVDPAAVLDLSASLNPLAPDVSEIVGKHLDAVRRYPDHRGATDALAAAIGVEPARLVLTNGGSEAIALVAAACGGTVEEPDFSLYPRAGGPRWRSNPHNPSGRLAADTEQAGVWDEAFYPLATGRWTRGDANRGAIVVGSLTKLFACPGLRVGYVLAPDTDTARRIAERQPAWSVNGFAADVLPDLLDLATLPEWSAIIATWRRALEDVLNEHGMDPEPSDANYLIVSAPGLRQRVARHGVLVRDCATFGLPDHVRIAVPDPDGLTRLAAALEDER
ncbi:MAG TPA: aminotransferase class I/II-fold pyridoxal phosphate-dependent enzyme [Acidimicrobiales bacterium]|nr:aminotransferase class I/II-fold pyridoxal phosphate-dependent enzyme [Acidimicrobiales bacterium]